MQMDKVKIKGRPGKWSAAEIGATNEHGMVVLFESDTVNNFSENVVAKYNDDEGEWEELASGYGDLDSILGDM